MSKHTPPLQSTIFCGIDVSASSLAVAVHQDDQQCKQRTFNQAQWHCWGLPKIVKACIYRLIDVPETSGDKPLKAGNPYKSPIT